MFYYCGENKNRAVVEIGIVLFGKVKICCCSAFRSWFGEILSVGVEGKDHVTGAVADGGVGMGSHVVQELMAGIENGLGAIGLLRGDGAEGSGKGRVNGT